MKHREPEDDLDFLATVLKDAVTVLNEGAKRIEAARERQTERENDGPADYTVR